VISQLLLFLPHRLPVALQNQNPIKLSYNFQEYKRTEFNKTIIPLALVGYEIGYSQLSPTGLAGYLLSHIQRALME